MAKVLPPVHTRFKPGQSGNPNGRPKHLLTSDDVKSVIGRFWRMTRAQLAEIIDDPNSTMGELTVANIMAKAAKDGDPSRFAYILDRSLGKPKAEDEVPEAQELTDEMLDGVVAYLRSRKGDRPA